PDEKISFPNIEVEVETKKVKRPLPDFLNITVEEDVPINKPGGNIFFDQSQAKHAQQILSQQKPNKFLTASVKDEMKILGTLFATYIIVEYDDKAYFIDQHAAHERTLYDRLCQQVEKSAVIKQPLLLGYQISLGAK